MKYPNFKVRGGWSGSLVLLFLYFFAEIGFVKLGGDSGSFLYVTSHFIFMPLISIIVIILTLRRIYLAGTVKQIFLLLLSLVIPSVIIFVAVTGNATLPKMLQVDFNR